MKNKWKSAGQYYIVTLLILVSGTIYSSYVYYEEFLYFLLFNAFIINGTKKINKKSILTFLMISTIILLNYFVYQQNSDGYFGLVIKLLAVLLLCNSLNIKELANKFMNVVFIISLISLVCYFLWITYPILIMSLVPVTEVWGSLIRPTFFYTFPYMDLNRNFGPFKEPGMFQVFVNLALYINFKKEKEIKKVKFLIYTSIFVATIVTTFSTAGLITTFIIFIYFIFHNLKSKNNKKIIFFAFIALFGSIWAENEYGIIQEKFDANNSSFKDRSSELEITYKVLAESPFLGVGYQNNFYNSLYGNIKNGTNGIFALYQQFGLFFASIILFFYINGIRKIGENFTESLTLFLIIFLSFSTEPTMFQPLFLILLFYIPMNTKGAKIHEK